MPEKKYTAKVQAHGKMPFSGSATAVSCLTSLAQETKGPSHLGSAECRYIDFDVPMQADSLVAITYS